MEQHRDEHGLAQILPMLLLAFQYDMLELAVGGEDRNMVTHIEQEVVCGTLFIELTRSQLTIFNDLQLYLRLI